MTKEEIIEMAMEEADFVSHGKPSEEENELFVCTDKDIVRFYNLVAAKAEAKEREALAQPGQEPVGQLLENAFGRGQVMWFNKPKDESMLYTTPQSEKYPQIAINPEIVGYVAPQRTWVGLTDEEIKAFDTWHDNREEEVGWCNPSEIVAYIEAKLKEKNTRRQK